MERRPNRPSSRRGKQPSARPQSSRRAAAAPDVPKVPKIPQVPQVPGSASPRHPTNKLPTQKLPSKSSGKPAGRQTNYHDEDPDERRTQKLSKAPPNPLLTTRKQSQRNTMVALSVCAVALALAVGLIVMLTGSGSSSNTGFVPIEDRMAEKLDAETLSSAVNAGMQSLKRTIESNKRMAHKGVTIETPRNLAPTLAEMAEMKKRSGENAGYYCHDEHKGDAGSPHTVRYAVLRSPLPESESNPTHDLEFIIIRAYLSEAEMQAGMKSLRSVCSKTQLMPLGRYSFAQHSQNINADAYQAISNVSRAFVRGFQKIVPPPGAKKQQ